MSFVQSPTIVDCVYQRSGNNNNNHNNATSAAAVTVLIEHHHRIALKRKLEDYGGSTFDDDFGYLIDDDINHNENGVVLSDLVSVRMRRDDHNVVHSSDGQVSLSAAQHDSRVSDDQSVSNASCNQSELTRNPLDLQFFVRMMPEGYNLVIKAYANDTVRALHEKIHSLTGIPVIEQRLTYRGKQLQWEQSLAECSIQNDAGLQLLGRLRSSKEPQHWQVMDDMVSMVCRLCRGELHPLTSYEINTLMSDYFSKISKIDIDLANNQLQVFMSSSAPTALVMLYLSPIKRNKDFGECCIMHFLSLSQNTLPKPFQYLCGPILLEFCRLLRRGQHDDPLYVSCRSALGSLLESNGILYPQGLTFSENKHELIVVQEIFPFVFELAKKLSRDLVSSMESGGVGPLASDVHDFAAFLVHLRATVASRVEFDGPTSVVSDGRGNMHSLYGGEVECLLHIFIGLLCKMDYCLRRVEECLVEKGIGEGDIVHSRWSQYLSILKELNATSKLYPGAEDQFWTVLRDRNSSLCWLIIKYVKRNDDHRWILEHKGLLDFECRRHLAMMMFPEVKEDYEELHEMLIDRSQLLAESFEYIAHADPEALHAGLFMEFKNEEATGPGVLREWFFLVCQAIFNPQNALFVACPNDCRRFYPNTASKVDPLHLEYFKFAGRVVALALMHKVQIGIVFDRVFFMQLAGNSLITLEDICDADPCLYSSCKKILEMEPEFIDSDILGLTFVREIEELGSRRVVELCPAGKSIVVNSKNRKDYVSLLVQNQFATSMYEQVSHFAKGFADMLSNSKLQKFFFQSLEMEDLDRMLYGSEGAINVEDWKAHTEYNGYKETDTQILWFWKIVEEMSADQRRVLLFFWTSLKYLPVEGFRGLASRLYIYESLESHDHLPSSHTCFYRLCFPPYSSMAMMRDRFNIITQEHVGTSFGTW